MSASLSGPALACSSNQLSISSWHSSSLLAVSVFLQLNQDQMDHQGQMNRVRHLPNQAPLHVAGVAHLGRHSCDRRPKHPSRGHQYQYDCNQTGYFWKFEHLPPDGNRGQSTWAQESRSSPRYDSLSLYRLDPQYEHATSQH